MENVERLASVVKMSELPSEKDTDIFGKAVALIDRLSEELGQTRRERDALADASQLARTYLEERGIRTRGTVGRTKILPVLDVALALVGR